MMHKSVLMVVAGMMAAAPAAATLTFDDVAPLGGCSGPGTAVVYRGLSFTGTGDCTGVWSTAGSGRADNGTPALMVSRGDLTIRRADGGVFTLSQFDIGLSWNSTFTQGGLFLIAAQTVVPGSGFGGGSWRFEEAFDTIRFGDALLRSVTFAFSTDGLTAVDNIASTVPEPASWATLIAGFGVVGAAARRRRVTANRPAMSPGCGQTAG
jgi:hypothetical protein